MYKIFLFLLALLFSANSSHSQTAADSLLTHYPLQAGNAWDYSGGERFLGSYFYPTLRTVTAIKDSLHTNGKLYTVLESVTYLMRDQPKPGALGRIYKEITLQRIDTTSFNVYEVPFYGGRLPEGTDELLVDSLKAQPGDQILKNYGEPNLMLELFDISEQEILGELRTTRSLYTVNFLTPFQFTTASGLGETYWEGGEGEIGTHSLDGAVINDNTLGTLIRTEPPGLVVKADALIFSQNQNKHRIYLVNNENGLTIIDSVAMSNEAAFYSDPRYDESGYGNTYFSKGPFLVFPNDSISLDLFLEDSINQAFEDTLRIYASGLNGEILPRLDMPVTVKQRETYSFHYPLNIGDYWEYVVYPLQLPETFKVIGDSLLPDGQTYRVIDAKVAGPRDSLFHRIDEQNNLLQYNPYTNQSFLYFKLNIAVGDRWKFDPFSQDDSLYFNVTHISDTTLWGHNFKYAIIQDFADLAPNTYYLAGSLGVFWHGYEGGYNRLEGAIIDGNQYGNLTHVETQNPIKPISVILFPNYPNPFNTETRISYEIPATGFVSLKIYNIQGEEVRTLAENTSKQGSHSVTWDGKNDLGKPVSSGLYIYRLQFTSDFSNRTLSRKLLLLK